MESSSQNRAEYERRIHRVLAYIDNHLDEPIDLNRLAKEANFSAFHFHRIFAAHIGETVGNYLTRRRVELAAARLVSQPLLSVLNVSLAVGFGSAEAFSRAFKKHYGSSPLQWKKMRRAVEDENSKLSQINSSLDHETASRERYNASMENTKLSPLQVIVTKLPSVRIAYIRYQGPFGPAVGQFWQTKAFPWMAANNLLDAPKYGISRDDPAATDSNKLRYDAGVEINKTFVPSQNAQIDVLPGGIYASAKFFGTPREIEATWNRLLREWLPASGYQLDARPCFEYYPPNGEGDETTGAFTCDLCIPITKL